MTGYERMNDERIIDLEAPQHRVVRLKEGLEFGEGPISCEGQDPAVLAAVDEAIASPGITIAVDRDESGDFVKDDGCGDGRAVKFVYRNNEPLKRSLNRPKVFGGGVAMTVSDLIGSGRAKKPLQQVFEQAMELLEKKNMEFGAHTDDHAEGENSGCGAIDKAPQAITAAVKYETEIRDVIDKLGLDATDIDEVYANFRTYAHQLESRTPYSGKEVMRQIIRSGKIVKELEGPHRERRIILNPIAGYTINQKFVREATHGEAQVFAVDIWRLQDIAANLYRDDELGQKKAVLAEVIYTLGVAAVLTKGDLPVYMVEPQQLALLV